MNIFRLAATLSVIFAIYSIYPYVSTVLKGKTKPHRLGWLVFTIMNGMVFFAQFFAGGRSSALISLAFFGCSIVMLILSFSKGTSEASRADWFLFALAVVAMIAWGLTKNNTLAIWLSLFIDLTASTMIILKVRHDPKTEDPTPWITGTIAYVFSCVTLFNTHFGVLFVRPIYGLVCDVAIVGAIYYYRPKHKRIQN